MEDKLPLIGITMGDPTGIGPEIAAKALSRKEIYGICRPLLIGDAKVMQQACKIAGGDLNLNPVKEALQGKYEYGTLDVLDLKNVDIKRLVYKKASRLGGQASLDYIYKAIELAIEGKIDATVTGPIHKEAINLAGCPFAGHTEIFAARTGTKDYAMMLVEGDFRVVHVTTHIALRDVPSFIKKDRIFKVIKLAHRAMKNLGIENPRIIVSGLNPHASDGGLFGDEEEGEILPAIVQAKKEGISVEGPISPDTAFVKLKSGQFDVAVAMYHDQGHIPLKLLGFSWNAKKSEWNSVSGVNVTLGLPIIRTSVDHGVAYGKAGEGRANPDSLIQAIKLAVKFSSARRKIKLNSI
ncbi:4-hydroxythreonine-4-phosphate dehydrogenase PdxA [Candidatus Aerophobetes bacterium]|nr:4-hydroxythreonine-4-phosphate dehydrogenase PdxA [Candidatus Aerophobetes bacterium]